MTTPAAHGRFRSSSLELRWAKQQMLTLDLLTLELELELMI